ncbi:MAG: leucine-rich repeat domain-containing protein, partial [Anaerotardibacter sp.]
MKKIVCELCGSSSLTKEADGMFHCQDCGTSYTVEAARKLLVEVPDETTSSDFEIENGVLLRYLGSEKEVVIPEGITTIGSNAFRGKTIESVVIPEGVTVIEDRQKMKFGDGAFKDCRFLSRVSLPESLEVIGISAFEGCKSLKEITLPKNLKRLGNSSFAESGLTSFTLPNAENLGFSICSNCRDLTDITVEDGIELIPASSFSNCCSLTEATLPESVTAVGRFAF